MRKKIHSYLGFAKRSGNLVSGYNACIRSMSRRKIKLLVLAGDLSENSLSKMTKEAEKWKVPYRVFSCIDEISWMTGQTGVGILGITEKNFSNIIAKEIDESRSSEGEVFQ
ncbi:MAG: ribosomal L7Ae/L30e/S12e/Gadd45 family protein [Clostridiales bacterium]|nr:ribosomal L7Ae/L30e/S12e/Gadd45 family protein [Clostridiales bacterium]